MGMMNATTAPKPPAARARIEAENKRLAEGRFGRYSARYVTSMEDLTAPATYYQGTVTNDLIRAAEYVEAVRAGGQYKSVTLYDRVEGRHVTAADVRRVREACGVK